MTDLTQKMIDDWKLYLKEEAWGRDERNIRGAVKRHGPIVHIEKVYGGDRTDGVLGRWLVRKIYQHAENIGTDRSHVLDGPARRGA